MAALTKDKINNWFRYHPPHPGQVSKYGYLREAGRMMATAIYENCPAGPDATAAVRKLREVIMMANASIACAPAPREPEPEPFWPCAGDCGSVLPRDQLQRASYPAPKVPGELDPPMCLECHRQLHDPATRELLQARLRKTSARGAEVRARMMEQDERVARMVHREP